MTLDGRSLIALIDRLAAVDERARSRVERLLSIGDVHARVLLAMAGGEPMTLAGLGARLDLSRAGAVALAQHLVHDALVVHEPGPHSSRLRLSAGAERELTAALGPLTERLDAVTAKLTAADRRTIAESLHEIANAGATECTEQPADPSGRVRRSRTAARGGSGASRTAAR